MSKPLHLNVDIFGADQGRDRLDRSSWSKPMVDMNTAIENAVADGDVVVGDPTDFKDDDVDMGWDIDCPFF